MKHPDDYEHSRRFKTYYALEQEEISWYIKNRNTMFRSIDIELSYYDFYGTKAIEKLTSSFIHAKDSLSNIFYDYMSNVEPRMYMLPVMHCEIMRPRYIKLKPIFAFMKSQGLADRYNQLKSHSIRNEARVTAFSKIDTMIRIGLASYQRKVRET